MRMRNRRAFTVLELLVVIGVIGVLAAMLMIGAKAVSSAARGRSTRLTLQNMTAMVAELKAEADTNAIESSQPTAIYVDGASFATVAAPNQTYSDDNSQRYGVKADPLASPPKPTIPPDPAIVATAQAIQQLLRSPKNAQAFAQLPPATTHLVTYVDSTQNPPKEVRNPVPVDAWGEPIIFVPAGGLTNVMMGGQSLTIQSPSKTPFWAACGPDGRFDLGDDNIYSFGN